MANAGFWHNPADFQPAWNRLVLSWVSGASGAVPPDFADCLKAAGFSAVARNSAGNYTATLNDEWPEYIKGGGEVLPVGEAYLATVATDVKVYAVDLAAKTISFVTVRPDTAAATDPAEGDTVVFRVDLGNLSTPAQG